MFLIVFWIHQLMRKMIYLFICLIVAFTCHLIVARFWQVVDSMQPLIVYFPDSTLWLSRAVPKANRREFIQKMEEIFDKITGPVVLICGQNKVESGSREREKFVSSWFFVKILSH